MISVSAKLLQGSVILSTAMWWVISRCIYSTVNVGARVQFCCVYVAHLFMQSSVFLSAQPFLQASIQLNLLTTQLQT